MAAIYYSCMVPGITMTSWRQTDYKNISVRYVRVQRSKHVRYAEAPRLKPQQASQMMSARGLQMHPVRLSDNSGGTDDRRIYRYIIVETRSRCFELTFLQLSDCPRYR